MRLRRSIAPAKWRQECDGGRARPRFRAEIDELSGHRACWSTPRVPRSIESEHPMIALLPKLARTVAAAAAAFLWLAGAPREARATLGGDFASVVANHEHLGGTRNALVLPVGERHDLQLTSGILVREYLSPAGSVYAVTWRGPRVPNLRELLGPYFAELSRRNARGGLHSMTFTGGDVVVQSSGHGRTFAGRAWVPSLVPSGIRANRLPE